MNIEMGQLLFAAAFILFLILVAARIFIKPLRLFAKLLFNSIFGLVLLIGFNFIGNFFDFSIPVNIPTILIAGFLGIPGLVFLIVVQIMGI